MSDKVAEWKGRQRAAMAQQLQLEEESLARLEAAAANSDSDPVKGSVHGGMFGGSEIDESMFDAPNMVKVCGWHCLGQAGYHAMQKHHLLSP